MNNGDGRGSNSLYVGQGDGQLAASLLLGAGPDYQMNAPTNPAEIITVNETLSLNADESSALFVVNGQRCSKSGKKPWWKFVHQ